MEFNFVLNTLGLKDIQLHQAIEIRVFILKSIIN